MNLSVRRIGSRRLQRQPEIAFAYYAPTVHAAEPAQIILQKANRYKNDRRLLSRNSSVEHNEYPLNNTFDTGYFPAFTTRPVKRIDRKVYLRTVKQPYFPATTTRVVSGRPLQEDIDRELPSRRRLSPPPVNWVAPQTFTAQGYPAWGVKQFRSEFNVKVQTFELKYFQELPPTPEQPPSAFKTHFEKTRQTKRKLRTFDYLPGRYPNATYEAVLPAYLQKTAFRTEFKRRILSVLVQPDTRIQTSSSVAMGPSQPFAINKLRSRRIQKAPGIPSGFEIYNPITPEAVFPVRSFRTSFKRRLLVPQPLLERPQPVFYEATVTAVTLVRVQKTRPSKPRDVEFVGIIYDTLSYAPFTAYLPPEVHRRKGWRKHVEHAELLYYPQTPPTPEQPLTAFQPDPTFRTSQKRVLQTPPIHLEYPRTEPSVIAWMPVRAIKRKETERKNRVVDLLLEYPQTPPIPFQASSLVRFTTGKRRDTKRTLRKVVFVPDYEAQPDISAAFRTGFKPEIAYLRGYIYDIGYVEGDIVDTGYVMTWLGEYDAYLEGEIVDIGYLEADMDGF